MNDKVKMSCKAPMLIFLIIELKAVALIASKFISTIKGRP